MITQFDAPPILAVRSVAPALALGNAVLLKPDLRMSLGGGVAVVRVFVEARLPEGVLQPLPGGPAVGEAVVSAREVRTISFTVPRRAAGRWPSSQPSTSNGFCSTSKAPRSCCARPTSRPPPRPET
ncbi:MAG TPA: aldehyde dehydrogenase family protein [Paenarthrobacter sp.]|nr:aldehyde dehydrogenase family protein [Paenarthrobacter sp.]